MHNLALFCKSYRGDLDRLKILKASVDRFNADKLPFYIVCPKADMSLMQQTLIDGKEKYELVLVSDESILQAAGLKEQKQGWKEQQVLKLCFYKMKLCKHYAIFDSDSYFISNFYFSDFMYDEQTPYFYMTESLVREAKCDFVRKYLGRKGKTYNFIYNSQVFSARVLENMEKNLLHPQKLTMKDLINIHPYEFQWYGEWFLKCGIYPLYWTRGRLKVYWNEEQYTADQKRGVRVADLQAEGYNAILMNNGWVKDKTYRDSTFGKLYRVRRNMAAYIHQRLGGGKKKRCFRILKLYLKLPVVLLKELWHA